MRNSNLFRILILTNSQFEFAREFVRNEFVKSRQSTGYTIFEHFLICARKLDAFFTLFFTCLNFFNSELEKSRQNATVTINLKFSGKRALIFHATITVTGNGGVRIFQKDFP